MQVKKRRIQKGKTSLVLNTEVVQKLRKRGYNVSACVRNYLLVLEKGEISPIESKVVNIE